jgi:hypothetical protein
MVTVCCAVGSNTRVNMYLDVALVEAIAAHASRVNRDYRPFSRWTHFYQQHVLTATYWVKISL